MDAELSESEEEDLVDVGSLSTDQNDILRSSAEGGSANKDAYRESGAQSETQQAANDNVEGPGAYQTVEFTTTAGDDSTANFEPTDEEIREQQYVLRDIRRNNKENLIEMHKLHLQCLVASLRIHNQRCNTPLQQSVALSSVPFALHTADVKVLLLWFRATFSLSKQKDDRNDTHTMNHGVSNTTKSTTSSYDSITIESSDDDNDIVVTHVTTNKTRQTQTQTKRRARRIPAPCLHRQSSTTDIIDKSATIFESKCGSRRSLVEAWTTICRALGYNARLAWSLNPLPQSIRQPRNGCFSKRRRVSKEKSNTHNTPSQQQKECTQSSVCGGAGPLDQMQRNNTNIMSTECMTWTEVYLDNKWTTIDCLNGHIDEASKMETYTMDKNITYVIVADNQGSIRDVTPRYASRWLTSTAKSRYAAEWWDTLIAELGTAPNSVHTGAEDLQLGAALQDEPFPLNLAAFKNHRLYALKRHLKQDEVLHPKATPVGMTKSESVYLRSQICVVKSREGWFKEGWVVRPEASPVKLKKRAAVNNKKSALQAAASSAPSSSSVFTDANAHGNASSFAANATIRTGGGVEEEIQQHHIGMYGRWQAYEYIPPTAKNGVVPKNAFGNVDLFKPSMIPRGCVLVDIVNVHKVAKDLGIDCARGVTDFEFRGGAMVPVLTKGAVVCKEAEDIIRMAAINRQQFEAEQTIKAKAKRAYVRWARFTRSLLVRAAIARHWEDD